MIMKHDTTLETLLLSEPDLIECGVLDMHKCVKTMIDVFQIYETGVYIRANPDWINLQFAQLNKEIGEEITECIAYHRYNELLGTPRCGFGDAIWDKVDMLKEGYREITADIRTLGWQTVNGQQEVVSQVRCVPQPRF